LLLLLLLLFLVRFCSEYCIFDQFQHIAPLHASMPGSPPDNLARQPCPAALHKYYLF
jgi:hypothetical protein